MLLIGDHKPQSGKLHFRLYHGMGAYKDIDLPVFKLFQYLTFF